LVEERKHELTVSSGPGLRLEADPTRLEQILVNLLTNAAKYTESGGRIELTARHVGREIVFKVKDNGVGIPPESLSRMFELFAQADRTLARSEGGLGIGLTLVRSLAEMHGGSVTARSEGTGRGSEFAVHLPAAKGTGPATASPRPRSKAAERDGRASRILVVDDNTDTARGMSKLLKLLGHEVATAFSGPEAVEMAREYAPEFVLLDIGLPGMDGYEVAARLRREEGCKDALIVAVSGYGQEDDRRRSKEAGFDHHLVKPIDHDALFTLLSRTR
jgi:CheY-like chemotaxis protein